MVVGVSLSCFEPSRRRHCRHRCRRGSRPMSSASSPRDSSSWPCFTVVGVVSCSVVVCCRRHRRGGSAEWCSDPPPGASNGVTAPHGRRERVLHRAGQHARGAGTGRRGRGHAGAERKLAGDAQSGQEAFDLHLHCPPLGLGGVRCRRDTGSERRGQGRRWSGHRSGSASYVFDERAQRRRVGVAGGSRRESRRSRRRRTVREASHDRHRRDAS